MTPGRWIYHDHVSHKIGRVKFGLCLVLLLLGLSLPLSHLLGMEPGQRAALQMLSFSPLPLVFDNEYYFDAPKVVLNFASGGSLVAFSQSKHGRKIPGPWHRVAAILHPLIDGGAFGQATQAAFLKYCFCSVQERDPATGRDEIPRSVSYFLERLPPSLGVYSERTVSCVE
jgi:hypothetical protein